uniref:MAGE domain-containing protein n=1 Tax=Sus scrofa TaxID=9823 RepID=A0A8D0YMQ5_PIG
MPLDRLSDLRKMVAQLFGWEEEEEEAAATPSPSSSSGPPPSSVEAEASQEDALLVMMADLVEFLLLKYRAKEPITKAEMLNVVPRDAQDRYPEVLSHASECMQLVFGLDLKEVDPGEHTYALVPTLGLTWDGMLSDEHSLPKTGLLVVLLAVIFLEGDYAPEEVVWLELGKMGLYPGKVHCIYGEPRALLTQACVQEGYLEYRQVPRSDPARYEFLWGRRAHEETSKLKVLEHLLRVNGTGPRTCRWNQNGLGNVTVLSSK